MTGIKAIKMFHENLLNQHWVTDNEHFMETILKNVYSNSNDENY